jgi:hypothetical protein
MLKIIFFKKKKYIYIYIYYFNIFLNKKHVEKQPLPQSQKTHSSIHPLILKNKENAKENANDNTDSTHMEI